MEEKAQLQIACQCYWNQRRVCLLQILESESDCVTSDLQSQSTLIQRSLSHSWRAEVLRLSKKKKMKRERHRATGTAELLPRPSQLFRVEMKESSGRADWLSEKPWRSAPWDLKCSSLRTQFAQVSASPWKRKPQPGIPVWRGAVRHCHSCGKSQELERGGSTAAAAAAAVGQ